MRRKTNGYIDKPWGYESLWAHTDQYVGKVLYIKPGRRLSRQYHEVKEETIYVMEGTLVLEIGSGWGGFAYQFKILRPNTTLFLLDLPPTLLFATVYLKGTFPDANSVVLTEANYQEVFENWGFYDFVFIPANLTDKFKPLQLDLAINMVSFQEMTSGQVKTYVDLLESLKCQRLYSLNRDRSPHNDELSTVTEIISTKYKPKLIRLLDVEYHSVSSKNPRILDFENLGVSQYRHIACTLKD